MNFFNKSLLCLLLLFSLFFESAAQVQKPPVITVNIFDSTFLDLKYIGISATTLSFAITYDPLVPFSLSDDYHSIWGMFSAKDFWPIYRKDLSKPTDGSVLFSQAKAFDIDEKGGYLSVFETTARSDTSEPTTQYRLFGPDLNVIHDLFTINVIPDSHGLGFSANRLIHYAKEKKIVYIRDDDTRDTMLYENIRTYNIKTGEDKQVFDYLYHAGQKMGIESYKLDGTPSVVAKYIDRSHYNAIDDFPGENAALISYRHNGVWKVNYTKDNKGSVAWILGGPPGWASSFGFREVIPKIEGQDLRLRMQHSVSVVDSSEAFGIIHPGDLLVYDNGDKDRLSARALVIRITEENGVVFGEIIWKMEFGYSPNFGSFRILRLDAEEGIALINNPLRNDAAVTVALELNGIQAARDVIQTMGGQLSLIRVANQRVLATYTISDLNFIYTCYLKKLSNQEIINMDCITRPEIKSTLYENVIWHYANGDTISPEDLEREDFNDERYFTYSLGKDQFGHETTRGYSRKFNFGSCSTNGTIEKTLETQSILLASTVSTTIQLKEDNVSYFLYSSEGQNVLSGKGKEINVKKLPEGWYILAYITANQKAGSEKIIVEREKN